MQEKFEKYFASQLMWKNSSILSSFVRKDLKKKTYFLDFYHAQIFSSTCFPSFLKQEQCLEIGPKTPYSCS